MSKATPVSPQSVQGCMQLSLDESFDYVIRRQRRKTIALHVLEDATVEVRAPQWVSRRDLAAFVEERSGWVIGQRRSVLEKMALRPQFVSGQQHYFLGQRYPLELREASRSAAKMQDSHLLVSVPNTSDRQAIEQALIRWYRRQAESLFEERLFFCFENFPGWFQDRYPMPTTRIRKMRRRWGSCSSRGEITLNLALIKMPVECIDYVICHELCHLEVFHHGPAFYRLLSQVLEEWRDLEQLIERFADIS